MFDTNLSNKVATKILVVGGSTHNPCTPCKIRDALVKTRFLDEWAVIFANHRYWKINDTKYCRTAYKFKIEKEFEGIKINLIDDQLKTHDVFTGHIYILPDSFPMVTTYTTFSMCNCVPQIRVMEYKLEDSESLLQQSEQNETEVSIELGKDALGNDRKYFPNIDRIMTEVANNYNRLESIAGLIICGMDGDGAIGLQKIKSKGGKTAVQHPDECICTNADSMPKASLKLDNNHSVIYLEVASTVTTLTEWLSDIKWR